MSESEVIQFLYNLGINLRKPDLEQQTTLLLNKDAQWIGQLQRQLKQGHWKALPIERQMTLLYILNAYFRENHKNREDQSPWISVLTSIWDGLNIRASHEKEVKHILKMINIWSVKDKPPNPADSSSASGTSIFPRKVCEGWSTTLTNRAHACGITFTEAGATASTAVAATANTATSSSMKHSDSTPAVQGGVSQPVTIQAKVMYVQVTETTAKVGANSSNRRAVTASTGPAPAEDSDFAIQMHANIVAAMCQYQLQIFDHFLRGTVRRLDRWNMRVVMTASFALLHLYVREYGVVEVHSAALVVACIYLAGKAEYLFVKADKLRPIANKFLHSLNESPLTNNVQIYKYEAQMLRLLQYDVGDLPNPLRFLKALDILEANRLDDSGAASAAEGGVAPIVAPLSAANLQAHTTTSTSPAMAAAAGSAGSATSAAGAAGTVAGAGIGANAGGGGNSPRSVAAAEMVNPARRLLDQAVTRIVSEAVFMDGTLLAECDDYYLAAAVLLEEICKAYPEDDSACAAHIAVALDDLASISPALRLGRCVTQTTSQLTSATPQYPFVDFLTSLQTLRSNAKRSASSSNGAGGSDVPLMPLSGRCIRVVREQLEVVTERRQRQAAEEADRAKAAKAQREEEWKVRDQASRPRATSNAKVSNLESLLGQCRSGRVGGGSDAQGSGPPGNQAADQRTKEDWLAVEHGENRRYSDNISNNHHRNGRLADEGHGWNRGREEQDRDRRRDDSRDRRPREDNRDSGRDNRDRDNRGRDSRDRARGRSRDREHGGHWQRGDSRDRDRRVGGGHPLQAEYCAPAGYSSSSTYYPDRRHRSRSRSPHRDHRHGIARPPLPPLPPLQPPLPPGPPPLPPPTQPPPPGHRPRSPPRSPPGQTQHSHYGGMYGSASANNDRKRDRPQSSSRKTEAERRRKREQKRRRRERSNSGTAEPAKEEGEESSEGSSSGQEEEHIGAPSAKEAKAGYSDGELTSPGGYVSASASTGNFRPPPPAPRLPYTDRATPQVAEVISVCSTTNPSVQDLTLLSPTTAPVVHSVRGSSSSDAVLVEIVPPPLVWASTSRSEADGAFSGIAMNDSPQVEPDPPVPPTAAPAPTSEQELGGVEPGKKNAPASSADSLSALVSEAKATPATVPALAEPAEPARQADQEEGQTASDNKDTAVLAPRVTQIQHSTTPVPSLFTPRGGRGRSGSLGSVGSIDGAGFTSPPSSSGKNPPSSEGKKGPSPLQAKLVQMTASAATKPLSAAEEAERAAEQRRKRAERFGTAPPPPASTADTARSSSRGPKQDARAADTRESRSETSRDVRGSRKRGRDDDSKGSGAEGKDVSSQRKSRSRDRGARDRRGSDRRDDDGRVEHQRSNRSPRMEGGREAAMSSEVTGPSAPSNSQTEAEAVKQGAAPMSLAERLGPSAGAVAETGSSIEGRSPRAPKCGGTLVLQSLMGRGRIPGRK